MDNPSLLVQRALEALQDAEASGLEFVDVEHKHISGTHWRGKMQSLQPVPPGAAIPRGVDFNPADSQPIAPTSPEPSGEPDAVAALASKFKAPVVRASRASQPTLPAKIAQTTPLNTDVPSNVPVSHDKAELNQPAPVVRPDPVALDSSHRSLPETSPPPVSDPPAVDSLTVPLVSPVEETSPDPPLRKKKKKRKVKSAKAEPAQSAMSWTMRR